MPHALRPGKVEERPPYFYTQKRRHMPGIPCETVVFGSIVHDKTAGEKKVWAEMARRTAHSGVVRSRYDESAETSRYQRDRGEVSTCTASQPRYHGVQHVPHIDILRVC